MASSGIILRKKVQGLFEGFTDLLEDVPWLALLLLFPFLGEQLGEKLLLLIRQLVRRADDDLDVHVAPAA